VLGFTPVKFTSTIATLKDGSTIILGNAAAFNLVDTSNTRKLLTSTAFSGSAITFTRVMAACVTCVGVLPDCYGVLQYTMGPWAMRHTDGRNPHDRFVINPMYKCVCPNKHPGRTTSAERSEHRTHDAVTLSLVHRGRRRAWR
jgi:hypothetical protein